MGYGFYGFFGPYGLLFLAAILLSFYASAKVRTNYNKYSRVLSKTGMTGQKVARSILDANGLSNIKIEIVPGNMTDHYDPSKKVLRLSPGVHDGNSIASISIAAHECGHAIQDKEAYTFLRVRNAIAVPVSWASNLSWILIFIGIILTTISMYTEGNLLLDIGIIMFFAVLVFQLITLPVEFDASNRAIKQMQSEGIIFQEEVPYAKKMLSAAALTYVAALVVAIVQMLRLLAIRGRN